MSLQSFFDKLRGESGSVICPALASCLVMANSGAEYLEEEQEEEEPTAAADSDSPSE